MYNIYCLFIRSKELSCLWNSSTGAVMGLAIMLIKHYYQGYMKTLENLKYYQIYHSAISHPLPSPSPPPPRKETIEWYLLFPLASNVRDHTGSMSTTRRTPFGSSINSCSSKNSIKEKAQGHKPLPCSLCTTWATKLTQPFPLSASPSTPPPRHFLTTSTFFFFLTYSLCIALPFLAPPLHILNHMIQYLSLLYTAYT